MWNLRRLAIFALGIAITLVGISLLPGLTASLKDDNRRQLRNIAMPYVFDLFSWEMSTLSSLSKEMLYSQSLSDREIKLRSQIQAVLSDEGILILPPIIFRLEKPPHLLVVSLKQRIVYFDRMLLRQELTVEEMEYIEDQIDALGLSALVVSLAGFSATYPTIISDQLNLTDTINTTVEEWLHQYLIFRPLGFLYLLDSVGIRRNSDIVTMNETLAGLFSREVGSEICERYYKDCDRRKADHDTSGLNFDNAMRETRLNVDQYLSAGKIEEAECYMEKRREEFVEHGYHIRKLNQAYFAFHGIYGSDPASVSPMYKDLRELRAKSMSLKDFLSKAAAMTSYADLIKALED